MVKVVGKVGSLGGLFHFTVISKRGAIPARRQRRIEQKRNI